MTWGREGRGISYNHCWVNICTGFPCIGNFLPEIQQPVGLPVFQMLKHSLNSGRDSALITLQPWLFLVEGKRVRIEWPTGLGHVTMGSGLGLAVFPWWLSDEETLPPPHLWYIDFTWSCRRPELCGPTGWTHRGQSHHVVPTMCIHYLDRILKNCNRKCSIRHGT